MNHITSKQAASRQKTTVARNLTYEQLLTGLLSEAELRTLIHRNFLYQLGQEVGYCLQLTNDSFDVQILACDEDGRLEQQHDPVWEGLLKDLTPAELIKLITENQTKGIKTLCIETHMYAYDPEQHEDDRYEPTGEWPSFDITDCGGVDARKEARLTMQAEEERKRKARMKVASEQAFCATWKTAQYLIQPLCRALAEADASYDGKNGKVRCIPCGSVNLGTEKAVARLDKGDVLADHKQDYLDAYLAAEGVYGLLVASIRKVLRDCFDIEVEARLNVNWKTDTTFEKSLWRCVYTHLYGGRIEQPHGLLF